MRCPFRFSIRGYFSAMKSGLNFVENVACREDGDNVLGDPRFVKNKPGTHSQKRNDVLVRRFLPSHMTDEAVSLRKIGRIPFCDSLIELERKQSIYVRASAIRPCLDWHIGKQSQRD